MENYQNEKLPLVTVIVPCRNEEKFIAKCLNSILDQDYPKEKMEVFVVDGQSEDNTKNIIKNYSKKYSFIKLLDNPKKITPSAFNIGIKESHGEFIILIGAHAKYKNNYISECIKTAIEYNADNVGGILKIMPRENTLINRAIVFASSSVFGAGNAYYRRGYSKGVKWVDTVFGGCYRREIFEKIGFFDERLVKNQDFKFNAKLRKAGGKILLSPEIVSYYYPRPNLSAFIKNNFRDGFWITYPLSFGVKAFSWRHIISAFPVMISIILFILGFFNYLFWYILVFCAIAYIIISEIFSIPLIKKEKDIRYLLIMPVVFFTRHFGHGAGSLCGLIKAFFKKTNEKKN